MCALNFTVSPGLYLGLLNTTNPSYLSRAGSFPGAKTRLKAVLTFPQAVLRNPGR